MSRFFFCILIPLLSGGVTIHAQQLKPITTHAYARIKIDLNDYLLAGGSAELGGGSDGESSGLGSPSGMGGFPMSGGETSTDPKPKKAPPIYYHVNIPVEQRIDYFVTGDWIIKHEWGKTWVPKDDIHIVKFQNEKDRFRNEQSRFRKSNKTPLDYLHLARFALQRGLLLDFERTMKEMSVQSPNHFAVRAYKDVHKMLKTAPKIMDPRARELKARWLQSGTYQEIISEQGHYFMLNKLRDGGKQAKARLQEMERTYATFFYWWALHGVVVPPPEYQLVVVLDNDTNHFRATHFDMVGELPVVDGFTIRRENVAYLSSQPLSGKYRVLAKNNSADWSRVKKSYEEMLDGERFPSNDIRDVPKLQTRSLVQKIIEEDVARAHCTQETVNQLLAATEMLPRNVTTAKWFRYGLSRYFSTPPQACFPGSGLPDWSLLIDFQVMKANGSLRTKNPDSFMLRILTDQNFRDAQKAWKLLKVTRQYNRTQQQQDIAETTAWALTYHLMGSHPNQVLTYLKELRELPRDVEYDSRVLAGCFARAFDMENKNSDFPIDLAKLRRMGSNVISTMQSATLDVTPLHYPVYEERLQAGKK